MVKFWTEKQKDILKTIIAQFSRNGRVWWREAFAVHPDWLREMPDIPMRRLVEHCGTWMFRQRRKTKRPPMGRGLYGVPEVTKEMKELSTVYGIPNTVSTRYGIRLVHAIISGLAIQNHILAIRELKNYTFTEGRD